MTYVKFSVILLTCQNKKNQNKYFKLFAYIMSDVSEIS